MPPASCLVAPDRDCLRQAIEALGARFETPRLGSDRVALGAFRAIEAGLDDPAMDAMLLRADPRITPERLQALKETARRTAATAAGQAAGAATPPVDPVAERARILAIRDPQARVAAANRAVAALAAARRVAEAEALMASVAASLRGAAPALRSYLNRTAARAFGAAADWPAWSRALAAAGYGPLLAAARTTGAAEADPTEVVVAEPLRQGIPAALLDPWIARARDPAFRSTLTMLVTEASFDRGRVAAWRADPDGFRRRVVAASARGEMLRRDPDDRYAPLDEVQVGHARERAEETADAGLALAAALQAALHPRSDATPFDRDRLRERVMTALFGTLVAVARRPDP